MNNRTSLTSKVFSKSIKARFLLAMSFIFALLSGCNNSSGGLSGDPTKLIIVTSDEQPLSMPVGYFHEVNAIVEYNNGTSLDVTELVTWNSLDEDKLFMVDNNAWGISVGETKLQAYLELDGVELSSSIDAEVTDAIADSLVIRPRSLSYPIGQVIELNATVYFSDGQMLDVSEMDIWAIEDIKDPIASIEGRLLTTQQVGHATLSANMDINGIEVHDSVSLTVTDDHLESLKIFPNTITLPLDKKTAVRAYAAFSNSKNFDVTLTESIVWHTTNGDIAYVEGGEVYSTESGTTQLSATYEANGIEKTDTINITVTNDVLESILITPRDITLPQGMQTQLVATGYYSDGSTLDISDLLDWSVEDADIARITGGTLYAKEQGSTNIKAEFTTASGEVITDSTTVSVNFAILKSLSISPVQVELPVGKEITLQAEATFSDGSVRNVTDFTHWRSLDVDTAWMSGSTVHAESVNTTEVEATYLLGDIEIRERITVTVNGTSVKNVVIAPRGVALPLGKTISLDATAYFYDNSSYLVNASAVWSTDDRDVARVVDGIVMTRGPGVAVISVDLSVDGIVVSDSIPVLVNDAIIENLVITSGDIVLPQGRQTVPRAIASFSNGQMIDVTPLVNWQTQSSQIAYVEQGTLKTSNIGSTTLTASIAVDGIQVADTVDVQVTKAVLEALKINPNPVELAAGLKKELTVEAEFSDGQKLMVTDQVQWLSDDTVASMVDNVLVGKVAGQTTVHASLPSSSVTASVNVEVLDAIIVDYQIFPSSGTKINVGSKVKLSAIAYYSDGSLSEVSNYSNFSVDDTDKAYIQNRSEMIILQEGVINLRGTWDTNDVEDNVTLELILNKDARLDICGGKIDDTGQGNYEGECLKVVTDEAGTLFTAPPHRDAIISSNFELPDVVRINGFGSVGFNWYDTPAWCEYLNELSFIERTNWQVADAASQQNVQSEKGHRADNTFGDMFGWPTLSVWTSDSVDTTTAWYINYYNDGNISTTPKDNIIYATCSSEAP